VLDAEAISADAAVVGRDDLRRRTPLDVADKGRIWLTLEATAGRPRLRPMNGENAIDY